MDKLAVFGLEGFSAPSCHLTSYMTSLIFLRIYLEKGSKTCTQKTSGVSLTGDTRDKISEENCSLQGWLMRKGFRRTCH